MRSRYRIHDSGSAHFVTSTIVEWIPVFTEKAYCDVVTASLAFCRKEKGLRLYAYAVLDNHLHLLVESTDLGQVLQSFKRHTARKILQLAEQTRRSWLLNQFSHYKARHKRQSEHQVWQEGFHPKQIQSREMLAQKVHYIHENPVRRGYVDAPEHWRYSSARNYILNDHSVLEIDLLEP